MSVDWDQIEALRQRVAALPRSDQPVAEWLMDIDGVLNCDTAPRQGWPRYAHTTVAVNSLGFTLIYAPALIDLLGQLYQTGLVDFFWLTSWQDSAPAFARAVDLNIGWNYAREPINSGTDWWKLSIVMDRMHADTWPGLTIWSDDEIDYDVQARQLLATLDPRDVITVCPDCRVGLTPQEFSRVLTFIERRVDLLSTTKPLP